MIHFSDLQIVLQEVPGEISLCISATGCPLRCQGCHSPFLWKKGSGTPLTDERFISEIERYRGMITCVLFMGGEWDMDDLLHKLQIARTYSLHTCLYTGLEENQVPLLLKKELTWLKTGPWIASLGGLSSPTTHQRFIEVQSGKLLNECFLPSSNRKAIS